MNSDGKLYQKGKRIKNTLPGIKMVGSDAGLDPAYNYFHSNTVRPDVYLCMQPLFEIVKNRGNVPSYK